ncbi:MAG: DUF86 domain-containing protein [Nanoarchaeota archaeon]
MIRKPELYIKDILDTIELIEKFMSNISKENFFKDKEKQYAVARAIEIIGEATKQLASNFKKKYPKTEWKGIAGMRDILIHAYFGVDLEKVWYTIKEELPVLKKQIQQILKAENK